MSGDYQAVKAGQLILELEDTTYKATSDEAAAAALDAIKAQLAANQSAKRAGDAGALRTSGRGAGKWTPYFNTGESCL
jgi:multidrug efflux pump subunit AcrA (membrane-fusion protein)